MNSRTDLWTPGSPDPLGSGTWKPLPFPAAGKSLYRNENGSFPARGWKRSIVEGAPCERIGLHSRNRESPAGSKEAIKRVSVSDGARNSQGFDDGE